ncbi:MAG: Hpt domain-containing protein [Hyphomicrobiales bacterium]|nr:Hpt domain-containing protein [Alphaproteobacteria bacterium]
MASSKPSRPDIVTYGDHEKITPDTTKLRKTLRAAQPGEQDPVARAEQALAAISGDFSEWMHEECTRLDAARCKVRDQGLSKQNRQELFLAAHDVKGDSETLGYPEVGAAAESLCRLLEHAPDLNKIPLTILDQHVDAVRAIVREHERADIAAIAAALTRKLRVVTDEFLMSENQHRPDVLKAIQVPALVPGESF